MTIHDLINFGVKKLSKTSDSPTLDSEVLLSYVLKKSKLDIFVHMDKNVHKLQTRKFFDLLKKRAQGWPVAYLTNQKEFFGLKFYVNKNVLIPRPETEQLVALVLEQIKDLRLNLPAGQARVKDNKPLRILDIGTGSGNIIISLAKSLYNLKPITYLSAEVSTKADNLFFASDISSAALRVAKKNAKAHKVKITFKQGSLLKPWNNQNFDIIVANLPYLAKRTDPSTKFEPTKALIAKNKGLALFEKLFRQITQRNNPTQPPLILRGGVTAGLPQALESSLPPLNIREASSLISRRGLGRGSYFPKFLFLEIGHDQGLDIKKLTKKYLPDFKIKIIKDLSNRIRFVCLNANNSD